MPNLKTKTEKNSLNYNLSQINLTNPLRFKENLHCSGGTMTVSVGMPGAFQTVTVLKTVYTTKALVKIIVPL